MKGPIRLAALATCLVLIAGAMLLARRDLVRADGAVSIENFSFTPNTVTVSVGSTVTWTQNQAGVMHTVSADDNSFDSGRLAAGQTFSMTFSQAGTIAYHCNVHSTMHGTITVTAAASMTAGPTVTVAPGSGASAAAGRRAVAAGFNLIGVPSGIVPGADAVYAYDPQARAYTALANGAALEGGKGYWAYYAAPASIALPAGSNAIVSVAATAGTWYLVGNPSGTLPALVTGADAVYTFDAVNQKYLAATLLQPGDGAWALSTRGGTIAVNPGATDAPSLAASPSLTPSPTPNPTIAPATVASTQRPAPTASPTQMPAGNPYPYVPPRY